MNENHKGTASYRYRYRYRCPKGTASYRFRYRYRYRRRLAALLLRYVFDGDTLLGPGAVLRGLDAEREIEGEDGLVGGGTVQHVVVDVREVGRQELVGVFLLDEGVVADLRQRDVAYHALTVLAGETALLGVILNVTFDFHCR